VQLHNREDDGGRGVETGVKREVEIGVNKGSKGRERWRVSSRGTKGERTNRSMMATGVTESRCAWAQVLFGPMCLRVSVDVVEQRGVAVDTRRAARGGGRVAAVLVGASHINNGVAVVVIIVVVPITAVPVRRTDGMVGAACVCTCRAARIAVLIVANVDVVDLCRLCAHLVREQQASPATAPPICTISNSSPESDMAAGSGRNGTDWARLQPHPQDSSGRIKLGRC
jgi:hypothetical protein